MRIVVTSVKVMITACNLSQTNIKFLSMIL